MGAFREQLQHLLRRHEIEETSLDIAMRQITTFWLSIAHYEVDLYTGYFGPASQPFKVIDFPPLATLLSTGNADLHN